MNFFLVMTLVINAVAATDLYGSCVTPNNLQGICQPFKTCLHFYKYYQNPPMPREIRSLVRDSQCGKVDGQTFICCPQQIVKQCLNSKQITGQCIPINDCPKLKQMAEKTPMSTSDRQEILRLKCDFNNRTFYACCTSEDWNVDPETTTEPETISRNLSEDSEDNKYPLFPKSCGQDAQKRIIGGEKTDIDEFPWTVLIRKFSTKGEETFHCGGSLINDRYIITAAHCVKDFKAKDLEVRLGEWNTLTQNVNAEPVIDMKVTESIPHEDYRGGKTKFNDIALLRLRASVVFTNFVNPICLPFNSLHNEPDFTNKTFDVTGWGITKDATSSSIKLKVNVPFVTLGNCVDIYRPTGVTIKNKQICAGGENGKDSCRGDSGGPLMFYNVSNNIPFWTLNGIVSYGPKNCGSEGIPAVYTKVSRYIEWIVANVRP